MTARTTPSAHRGAARRRARAPGARRAPVRGGSVRGGFVWVGRTWGRLARVVRPMRRLRQPAGALGGFVLGMALGAGLIMAAAPEVPRPAALGAAAPGAADTEAVAAGPVLRLAAAGILPAPPAMAGDEVSAARPGRLDLALPRGEPEVVMALAAPRPHLAPGKARLTAAPPRPLPAGVSRVAAKAPVATGTLRAGPRSAAGKAPLRAGLSPEDLSKAGLGPGGLRKAGLMPAGAEPPERAATAHASRPAVALVIDDLGIAAQRSVQALRLPKEVTLSFLPYGPVSVAVAQAAAAKGHDIFVHLPMEPLGDADPGPQALRVGDAPARLRHLLDAHYQRFAARVPVAGINNHMGSRASADRAVMDTVMARVAEWGVTYLDSLTTPDSVAGAAARRHRVPFIARDVFIDPAAGPDVVLAQLDAVEALARRRGVAVAIAHPHETTLAMLETWVRGLAARGLRLVRVDEALRLRGQPRAGTRLAARLPAAHLPAGTRRAAP